MSTRRPVAYSGSPKRRIIILISILSVCCANASSQRSCAAELDDGLRLGSGDLRSFAGPLIRVGDKAAATDDAGRSRISGGEEALLIGRAEALLKNYDLLSARLILLDIAKRGSARGAFSLAETYDPAFWKPFYPKGTSDINQAKAWYEKSLELGEDKALARLRALRDQ